jgi:restriction endonuclease S subunit
LVNRRYFRPRIEEIRVWRKREKRRLIKTIETYGVDQLDSIAKEFEPIWTKEEIRVKIMRLLGCEDLSLYRSFKGGERAIKKEYLKNRTVGLNTDAWKYGVLVFDQEGKIMELRKNEEVNALIKTPI